VISLSKGETITYRNGFAIDSSIPAARVSSICSCRAFAETAMIGIWHRISPSASCFRIARVQANPPIYVQISLVPHVLQVCFSSSCLQRAFPKETSQLSFQTHVDTGVVTYNVHSNDVDVQAARIAFPLLTFSKYIKSFPTMIGYMYHKTLLLQLLYQNL